jgi:hypothetical protein
MQRVLSLSFAAGLMAVGVWAFATRLRARGRQRRRDLGRISDAWLSDPRSYDHEAE